MTLTACNTAEESVQLADHPFAQGGEAVAHAGHSATLKASTMAKIARRNNAPVVVAIAVVYVAKNVFDLANGNIGGAELRIETFHICVVAGTGAVLGSFLGPIGTIAGGVVGGMLGCFLADRWFD